jgi:multidrug efflux pump subunit AcrB
MWIVRLALNRPYTFIVAALILFLLMPVIMMRTPTDIFPAIEIPVVSVIWQYQGLNAEDMEKRVIYVHERALTTTVNDIEHVESTSYNGVGVIKVFFQPRASVDAAVAQVTAIAQTVLRQMPPGMQPPLVIRYNASNVPILQIGLGSNELSEQAVYDIAQNDVRIALTTIKGAALPWPYGGKTRIVNVDLDLRALQSKGLTPNDVITAINAQNLIFPAGTAKIGTMEYDVELNSSPTVVEELNDLPIKYANGAMTYIRDVAFVRDGYQPQQNIVRQDGVRGSLVTVFKNGSASTLDVVRRVKAALPNIINSVPKELNFKLTADQSRFVRAAVDGVIREGIIAAGLTALMILLFLGSWRSTLIIAVSIPLSVLCSIATLSVLGETINLMTLGGMALAVGILVDDATVEIENIHRNLAMGKELRQAILDGAQQIATTAFVSTLCICIVFVPMFFLTGVARYLFLPLAESVVFAMLASYIISRTLVPTLVMYLFRNQKHDHGHDEHAVPTNIFGRIQHAFERNFERLRRSYAGLLERCLAHRGRVLALFLAFFSGSWLLLPFVGQDFFPDVDAGQISLHLRAHSGTRIEETARLTDLVDKVIREEIPKNELKGIIDNLGIPNSGISLSYSSSGLIGTGDGDILISLNEDHHSTKEYIKKLRIRLNREFAGVTFYFLPADIISQTLNFGLPAPFDVQIYGKDMAGNRAVAGKIATRIRAVQGAVDVRVQQPADQPKLRYFVDRTKAAEIGLTELQVANNVLLSLSGSGVLQPAYYLNPKNGISYLVVASTPQHRIDSIDALDNIPISPGTSNAAGDEQLFSNVATLTRGSGQPVVSHYNVQPVIDVFGGVSGRDLGGLLSDIKPIVKDAEKELPRGSFILLRGQAETMHNSFVGLGWGLFFAIALVYLLLVVNFQSWTDPFIIVTALPGALAGVIWMLFLSQTTLSVPSLMGAIMCLGVATANSVLIVTFARMAIDEGKSALDAALEAGATRLRPVVMTALAMIIGMLPMSLGIGEGAEQNAPLGRAVIGGLLFATVATLFFVPVVFAMIHSRSERPESPETDPVEPTEPPKEPELAPVG